MRLLFGLLMLTFVAYGDAPAAAQPAGNQPAAPNDRVGTSPDLDVLIRVLQNDEARAALIGRLKAAAQAESHDSKSGPATNFASSVAVYTSGVAEQAMAAIGGAGKLIAGVVQVLRGAADIDVVRVWRAVLEVVAVMAITFAVYFVLRWLGAWIGRRCEKRAERGGAIRRVVLLLLANAADALTVVLAWGAGYGFALGFALTARVSFSQTLFLNAFLFVELAKTAVRLVTVPVRTHLRLIPLSDTDAAYWYFWSSRLASLLGYSFLFAAPLVLFSGSSAGAQSIRIVAACTATAMVVAIVLQNRDRVRAALARRLNQGSVDLIGRMAAYLGSIWHLIAILYVLMVLFVWLTNPGAALTFMLQATLQSLAAAGIGILLAALISRLISSGMRLPQDVRDRLPLLEGRLNAFIPAVLRVVRLVVLGCVMLTVGQIWGLLNSLGWLASGPGRELTGAVLSALLILAIGGIIHVAMASWVEYRFNPNFGSVPTPRERTLLSLFRNAFTIALTVIVIMLTLAQIGVNIAPLLAGAGVLGLAIGFGAQKLVQDIITGIFIQFENAMNEGEVVTAGGVTGRVERLTIRSVSIRDLNGVLHIMPFSSVDKVSNLMRHFSYHVAEIGVAYRENIADVKAAMHEAFERLKETDHGRNILEPLDMHGITAFADSSVTVRARIKTVPGTHLAMGRAYSEIVKEVFDARGIEIAFPHLTLYMGEDRAGAAPPLRILQDRRTVKPYASDSTPAAPPAAAKPVSSDAISQPMDDVGSKGIVA